MSARLAATCCLLLIIGFGLLSWAAVSRMSVTTDEPAHAYAAWLITQHSDYRSDREDPPLWKFIAALPQNAHSLDQTLDAAAWEKSFHGVSVPLDHQMHAIFGSPGVDGLAFIRRSRIAMLCIGMALAILVTIAGWSLAGPVAAVVVCALFCLNPNFIGFAPLVTSDVPFTLVFFAAAFSILLLGRRITLARVLAVAFLVGAALVTKFSGILLLPVLILTLSIRAFLPASWPAFRLVLTRTRDKLLASCLLLGMSFLTSFFVIWATYSFRFLPTPDPSIQFSIPGLLGLTAGQQLRLADVPRTQENLANWRLDLITRTLVFANEHHLLPQAYLAGFLYTRASTWNRTSYLLGQIRDGGAWYYFPLATLFKTPLSTLAAFFISAATALVLAFRRTWPSQLDRWLIVSLAIPFLVYAIAAINSDLNIGFRHFFPVFPFLFLFVALIASEALRRWKITRMVMILLFLSLTAETLFSFPNYISYFNLACGSPRHDANLLGDSNIDMNQDLLLLAQWQNEHPDQHLYLLFSSVFDPAIYGVHYTRLDPTSRSPFPAPATQPATLVTRVSQIQGLYITPNDVRTVERLRQIPPRQILGRSIYLYDYPLPTTPR